MLKIIKINQGKKAFLSLLLLADEQESMIDQYLDKGELHVLFEGEEALGLCVVAWREDKQLEIKNLAVAEEHQGKGYGRLLVNHIAKAYRNKAQKLFVGTGDSPLTLPFYEKCGFTYAYTLKNFFTDYYDHPIFEGGKQLIDMIYLVKDL